MALMGDYYKLNEDHSVTECTLEEWVEFFKIRSQRQVARTELDDGVNISTVFLGIDHGWGGRVLLFETMVFGLPGEAEIQERYATWDEAMLGHNTMVKQVSARLAK